MKRKNDYGSGMTGLIRRIKHSTNLKRLCGKKYLKDLESVRPAINETDIDKLIKKLKEHANTNFREKCLKEIEKFINSRQEKQKRSKFAIVEKDKNIWPWRWEEALERCIVASRRAHKKNHEKIYNQFPVGNSNKESVDLYIRRDNQVILVELKPWPPSLHPWHALIECVKNYYLFKEIVEKDGSEYRCKELIILAPMEYYEKYHLLEGGEKGKKGGRELYKKVLEILEKYLPVSISFKGIKYKKDVFKGSCIEKIDEDKWESCKKRTEKYDRIQNIKAFSIEALKEKEWKDILSNRYF